MATQSKDKVRSSTKHKLALKQYKKLWKEAGIDEEIVLKTKTKVPSHKVKTSQSLEGIRKLLGEGCGSTLCPCKIKLVFGDGNPKAELMFVGEGPGADEDAQGLPFVGRAGQLLNKMIEAMTWKREEVYIANVVKCRPPENRLPTPEEIEKCSPFLRMQIEAIRPKILVALGATAASTLLALNGKPLSSVRGKFTPSVWFPDIPVLSTYHPAYLLRNPPAKKIVWEDLKLVMDKFGRKAGKDANA